MADQVKRWLAYRLGGLAYRLYPLDVEEFRPREDAHWVTLGSPMEGGVHVLGSAEVSEVETSRRMVGRDLVRVPSAKRLARVPQWEITLTCKLRSFVSSHGGTYQEALDTMFGRAGIRG